MVSGQWSVVSGRAELSALLLRTLRKTKNTPRAGVTQWDRRDGWREGIDDVLGWDLSSD